MEPRKEAICDALARWIKQRPGLQYGNYGNPTSYRAECRSIARDKREAETLLAAVRWRDGITADDLIKAAQGAYSGRLSIEFSEFEGQDPRGNPKALLHVCRHCGSPQSAHISGAAPQDPWACPRNIVRIDYCTGQYWPAEYRRAVCAVLASALWYYTREHCMPAEKPGGYPDPARKCMLRAGDWLRRHFLREFGRGIQQRWFD